MPAPITVLIPVKNGMPWLRQTLASLEAQSFRDFEVLVWDNGSTDGTLEELARWIPGRLRGRVVADRPLPLGRCRAAMVDAATTELCAWVDADDCCHPERLALQIGFLRRHPEVGVLGANFRCIDEAGRPIGGGWSVETEDAEIRWRLRFACAVSQPVAMFRRAVLRAAGNYRDIAPGQDFDMWIRAAEIAAMANLPQVLLDYRRHTANITRTETPEQARQRQHRIVEANAASLFPGVDPAEAVALRRILVEERAVEVRLRHLRLLRRAAIAAARRIEKPDDYFVRTRLFRRQMRYLLLSWLKRSGVVRAGWPIVRSLAGAGRTA